MTSTAGSVLLTVAGVFAFASIGAVHAPADQGPSLPSVVVQAGAVTRQDRGQILEREFTVPPGTSGIDIDFSYPRAEAPIEFDLGVRGPGGIRGWSEDRTDHIHIDAASASYGYLPGPIEPGTWAVLIGVASVPDSATPYRVSVRLSGAPGDQQPVLRTGEGWYTGDLHAHSGHSDGAHTTRDGVRVPVSVQELAAAAIRSRLDFLAITDHNTTSHWVDVDRTQTADRRLLLLHGSEITTYEGHFNAIGLRRLPDFFLGPTRPMRALLRDAATDGAFLSINHPAAVDDDWCPGCGWTNLDADTVHGVRGVEVANGPTVGGDVPGWRRWAELLNAGHHLVAVGGSDTHDPSGGDRRIGQPTTVVYASALSERAIVDGLTAGRVYVRTGGAGGPSLDFSGSGGGRRVAMGGTLPAGPVTLTARIAQAAGQDCVWIRRGQEVGLVRLRTDPADVTFAVDAEAGDWYSLIVRSGRHPTALANAVYIDR